MKEIHYVYELKDPISGTVFYVGQTNQPKRRYSEHIHNPKTQDEQNIIENSFREGKQPIMTILHTGNKQEADRLEKEEVTKAKKGNPLLTNIRLIEDNEKKEKELKAMENQLNSFQKGMNLDVHPSFIPEDQYVAALNASVYNQLNSNNFLGNEAGFKNIVNNFEDLTNCIVIGIIPFENDFILFSIRINSFNDALQQVLITELPNPSITNPPTYANGQLQQALWSELGRLRRQPNLTYNYETVLADKDPDKWSGGNIDPTQLWNFQVTHQIDAVARRDASNALIVYWTDGLNKPRRVVITDENDLTLPYTQFFRNLAKQTSLQSEYSYPIVEYVEQIEGGNLFTGVYQFSARYLNETLDPTDFGYLSMHVPVVDDFRYEGRANYDGAEPNGPKVEKSIKLKINNVDTDYDFIQLAVVYQDPNNFDKNIRTCQRIRIPKNTGTDLTSIEYTFDGTLAEGEDQKLSLGELLYRSPRFNTAQHIEQKDGRLFLANLTQVVKPNLQYIANRVRLMYQVDEILVSDDSSFFGDYKEEANTFYRKGYRRGEVYSFALVGVFDDGTISDAFHIPGYVDPLIDLTTEGSTDTSYRIIYGEQNLQYGYLGTYVSTEQYNNGVYQVVYPDGSFTDLDGQRVRHHVIPETSISPHIRTLDNGDNIMSILGIRAEGVEEAIDSAILFPSITDPVTAQYVKDHLVQIVLVRELRDKRTNKSVIAQGCLNRLIKQAGRQILNPTNFAVDYKLGTTPIPVDLINSGANMILSTLNPLYSILLGNINFNGRIRPYNIAPTYAIDPFWGGTIFGKTNEAPITFDNGDQDNITAVNNNFAFSCPEENFVLDFRIPGNCNITNVLSTYGNIQRVINTRIEPNQIFLDGSYSNSLKYPYYKKYRGAYYHLNCDFNRYGKTNQSISYDIRSFKRTKFNDVVVSNENLNELYTNIIENYNDPNNPNTTFKLNNYENEGYVLLNLKDPNGGENSISLTNFFNTTPIIINVGCKFYIYFAPYIPLWLLKALDSQDGLFTPDDYEAPFGAGIGDFAKATSISTTLVLSLINVVIEFFAIRGAVIDLREVQEGNGKIAGFNSIFIPNPFTTREIYSITQDNDRQYGDVTEASYYECGILFSLRNINNNNDSGDLNRYRINENGISVTRSIFNGDTFINKYFFKTSRNLSYQVHNIFQNELNKYCLDNMNAGGGLLALPYVTFPIPIPNILCIPGSVFGASISSIEGRLGFPGFPIDTDAEIPNASGLRAAEIDNEFVYDPLYPASFSSDTDGFQSGKFGTQMRGGNSVWLESQINCDYRHRPLSWIESKAKLQGENNFTNTPDYDNARLGVPYFPKDSLQWCFEVSPEYGHSNGYDQRYSAENNLQIYTVPRIIPFDTNQYRYRVIFSESIYDVTDGKGGNSFQKSELSDKYRIFFPGNYQDISKHKGQITNIFINADHFYIHTEKSLFMAYVNPLEQTKVPLDDALILAKAGVFKILPKEIMANDGGYAGCVNKWASVSTPNGHTFVDLNNRKVYNLTEGLEEISQLGLKNWFYQNLSEFENTSKVTYDNLLINEINNPANPLGIGISAFYDPLCNRYVLSLKKKPYVVDINQEIPGLVTTVNQEENIAVSFGYNEKCWISFHSYCSPISSTNDQYVYSFPNYITNAPDAFFPNQMMVHNRYVGDVNFPVYSLYGLFYEQFPVLPTLPPNTSNEFIKPFSIKYVCNKDVLTTKTFDNLVVFGQMINENRGYLKPMVHFNDFFNTIQCYNDYANSGKVNIRLYPLVQSGVDFMNYEVANEITTNAKQYNNEWRMSLPFNNIVDGSLLGFDYNLEKYIDMDIYDPANVPIIDPLGAGSTDFTQSLENRPRLKGKYLIIDLTHNNRNDFYNNNSQDVDNQNLVKEIYNLHFVLFSIQTKFRINHR
jgi:predicted GIY-YIG superfamily endonuclease